MHWQSTPTILGTQSSLATTYQFLGRHEQAHNMRRDVYFGFLRLFGEEHRETLREAVCYSSSFMESSRFEEAKSVLHKTTPVARRVLGDTNDTTLRMRLNYARALYEDPAGTPDDLREAVTTLEDVKRIARRVFGGAHPLAAGIDIFLRDARARAALRARTG